jgi:hypothetical protein
VAPTNVQPPVVTGNLAKGETLTCQPGSWTGSPALSYQWLRDGTAMAGSTQPTYRVRGRDVGHALACRVTARNAAGSAVAVSAGVPPALSPGSVGLPPSGQCVGSRGLKMRLRLPAAWRAATVGVYVDGRHRLSLPGRSLPGVVWVRKLPPRRFQVGIRAVTRKGAWARAARSYKRC